MSRSNNRTAVGLLAALAIIAVIFYFSMAASSVQNKGNQAANSSTDSDSSSSNSALRGTFPPTDWDDEVTATPTAVVYESDSWDWLELPSFARTAATTLGYTRESWDADSLRIHRRWDGLSMQEHEAAKALGYDREYWNEIVYEDGMLPESTTQIIQKNNEREYDNNNIDDGDDDDDQDTEAPTSDTTSDGDDGDDGDDDFGEDDATATPTSFAWDSFDWEDLPDEMKDAASQLGFTEDSWDDWIDIPTTPWDDLTPQQQVAAHALDWDRSYWEDMIEDYDDEDYDDEDTAAPTSFANQNFAWDDLPPRIRESAEFLGWTEDLWCDEGTLPLRASTRWEALSSDQVLAAEDLGFTPEVWNDY